MAKRKGNPAKKKTAKKGTMDEIPAYRKTQGSFFIEADQNGDLFELDKVTPHAQKKTIYEYLLHDGSGGAAGWEVTELVKDGDFTRYLIQPIDEETGLPGPSWG